MCFCMYVCICMRMLTHYIGKEVLKICILHCIYSMCTEVCRNNVCFTYARFTKVQLQKSKQGHKYRSCKHLYPYSVCMCYVHSYMWEDDKAVQENSNVPCMYVHMWQCCLSFRSTQCRNTNCQQSYQFRCEVPSGEE